MLYLLMYQQQRKTFENLSRAQALNRRDDGCTGR